MNMTLILYESKYGFTEMIARNLSLILGPAKCCKPSEFKGNSNHYETIVICTPVYSESVSTTILSYLLDNYDWIKQKKVILICTCLAKNMAEQYLKPLHAILGNCVITQSVIGGIMNIDKLNSNDLDAMKRFCNQTGFILKDYDLFTMSKFIPLALHLKEIKDQNEEPTRKQMITQYIEDFINHHNTCTLSTGQGNTIRATPIEYIYKDGSIYIFSEGGVKFANLLLNPNVSIGIYDPFKSMKELGGLQITGNAQIVNTDSDEYLSVLSYKGLNYQRISSLPVALNLIKINISKFEFLWSGFPEVGLNIKQIVTLKN